MDVVMHNANCNKSLADLDEKPVTSSPQKTSALKDDHRVNKNLSIIELGYAMIDEVEVDTYMIMKFLTRSLDDMPHIWSQNLQK